MTVAVVGDGAVGLSAVLAAKRLGAGRIIALSATRPDRRSPASSGRPTSSPSAATPRRGGPRVDRRARRRRRARVRRHRRVDGDRLRDRPPGLHGRRRRRATRVVGSRSTRSSSATSGPRRRGPGPPVHPRAPRRRARRGINPGRVFDFETDLEHCRGGYAAHGRAAGDQEPRPESVASRDGAERDGPRMADRRPHPARRLHRVPPYALTPSGRSTRFRQPPAWRTRDMTQRTWLITGVSSGFGRELANSSSSGATGWSGPFGGRMRSATWPSASRTFHVECSMSPTRRRARGGRPLLRRLGRIDVIVSNAGFGLFGAAEELTDEQVHRIIDDEPRRLDPAHSRRASAPARPGRRPDYPDLVVRRPGRLRRQLSLPRHEWGIEGFGESVAQEVAPFGIGYHRGAGRRAHRIPVRQRAGGDPMPAYDGNPAHGFRRCSIRRMGSLRATRSEWRRGSSRASTPSPRRCVWCSARGTGEHHRPGKRIAGSRRSASSRPRPTSHPASERDERAEQRPQQSSSCPSSRPAKAPGGHLHWRRLGRPHHQGRGAVRAFARRWCGSRPGSQRLARPCRGPDRPRDRGRRAASRPAAGTSSRCTPATPSSPRRASGTGMARPPIGS